ncbi:oligosaccharide flippase family protein [Micromonospora sp. WMMA1363]|uniref:oligosaccharide flippase family protein n=1 Tax=Micromonospora sp. WMMA1363 TaxID=3053985 RepID=UPI00259CA3D1|nr:oligosaccharide flippase family protein [Micromonospora sp. WMMA1363]MDM4718580.1 oligosaccharide flippase family protein [Micromonospora sp. WMMA1363]
MSVEERPAPVAERPAFFAKAARALGWSMASTIINRLSTLAIGIALARILGPDAFGTFAVALVVLLAVLSFNELGVSLAIVRWPGDPREIAPTVATLSVLTSTLVYGGLFLGAPLLARVLGDPGSTAVIRILGLSVIVSGLVATPVALLQRAFRQDRKAVADLVTNWTSALASIGLALAGNGAMSLALGQLAGSLAGAVLFGIFAPQGLRFGFDPAKARALLRFGLPLAGSSIVLFATTNLDRVVVGATLGPTALGYYVLALQLATWPVTVFSQPVRAVVPAALARLHDDPPAMRRSFLAAVALLGSVTLPACLLLAAASDALIRFLYGDVWQPAAGVLLWLGPLAALRILFELCYDYFVVIADTRVVLNVQVVWFVVLLPSLYAAGTLAGLQAAAAVQFAVALLVIFPLYLTALRRAGIRTLSVAARLGPPLLGAVAVVLVALLMARAGAIDLVVLAVAGVTTLAAIGLLGYRLRGVIRELKTVG